MNANTLLKEIKSVLIEKNSYDRAKAQLKIKQRSRPSIITPQNSREYWDILFRFVLKENEFAYAFYDRQDLSRYINDIELLPNYILSNPNKLIEADRFCANGEQRQKEIIRIMTVFSQLKNKIFEADRKYIKKLKDAPEEALTQTLHEHNEAVWICAQILYDHGFNIISNRHAANAFAKIYMNSDIGTYGGWLRFLSKKCRQTKDTGIFPPITENEREIDFLLRYIKLDGDTQDEAPELPSLRSQAQQNQIEIKNIANELMTGNAPELEQVTRYLCHLLENNLYQDLQRHEPDLLSNLTEHAANGFKNVTVTEKNATLVTLLKACYRLFNPGFDIVRNYQKSIAVKSHAGLYNVVADDIRNDKREICLVVILDVKHRVIYKERASIGNVNTVSFDPRLIFGPAIQLNAHAVAFAHNHPSGDPAPSSQDITVTQKLNEIASMLGFRMLDHLIIGKNCYYSTTSGKLFQISEDLDKPSTNPA